MGSGDPTERDATDGTVSPAAVPSRYLVVQDELGPYLACCNAANLRLRVVPGLAVRPAQRGDYPPQTIFLDGAYAGAPFLDNDQRQYSLDHHAECLRQFTLAPCEQAVVMLLQGLPLTEGTWQVYVCDLDADALLAAWIILNHSELLRNDRALLRAAMPLIRIEGVIDAHGLEMGVLTGFAEDVYAQQKGVLDQLLARWRELQTQRGIQAEVLGGVQAMLDEVDHLFLTESYRRQLLTVSEVGSVPLEEHRVAILCRSSQSIYEVEVQLKERYARQLGVIVLDKGGGRFTLRQSDAFLHHDLTSAYPLLNRQDPKADPASNNLWGGSGDIGGSPRATGSGLSGEQILQVVRAAYGRISLKQRLRRWGRRLVG